MLFLLLRQLWGTCQGFQVLNVLAAASKDVMCLQCFDSEDISLPLNFSRASPYSIYAQLSKSSLRALSHAPVTMNFHHDGVEPALYGPDSSFPELPRFFRLLSTNLDRKGRAFVSSVQANKRSRRVVLFVLTAVGLQGVTAPNIIGTQYHPERPAFEFSSDPGRQLFFSSFVCASC